MRYIPIGYKQRLILTITCEKIAKETLGKYFILDYETLPGILQILNII